MAVVVGDNAFVTFGQRFETNVGAKVVKVGVERRFAVVVIYFAVVELDMADREIEDAGIAAALAGRSGRKIVLAVAVDLQVNHGMIDEKLAQVDLAMQRRNDFEADGKFVGVKQRRLAGAFGAAQRDVVEVRGERRQAEIEAADLGVASGGQIGLLHDFVRTRNCWKLLLRR